LRILDRYITRSLLLSYLGALLTFISLYLIVDLFANSDEWLQAKMSLPTVLDYYLNLIPGVFILVGPVALLLATLFGLGTLCRNNELTAMQASGISLYRTLLPLLLLAFFISLFTMFINEASVPQAARRVNEIQKMRQEKHRGALVYRDIQLFGESGNIFYVKSFNKKEKVLKGIQILKYSSRGLMESRIDAKEAKWSDGRWILSNGFRQKYDERGEPSGKPEPLRELKIAETPEDFSASERKETELDFRELKKRIRTLEKGGVRPRRELVELYSKLSLPLANLIIILIGIPFALHTRRGGLIVGFGKAIGIGFTYLACFRLGQLLGRGTLPPIAGAWLANIIFATVGIILIIRVRK